MIVRQSALPVSCTTARHASSLFALPALATDCPLYVVDLSQGPATGLHAARELGAQLGVELPASVMGRAPGEQDPTRLVSTWVDAEGRGDSIMAHNAAIAELVAGALCSRTQGALLILLGAADETTLPAEERHFLWFLLHHLADAPIAVVIQVNDAERLAALCPWIAPQWVDAAAAEPTVAPHDEHDPLAWLPGLVPSTLLVALAELGHGQTIACLPLDGALHFVAPECRPAAASRPPSFAPAVLAVVREYPLLHAQLVARGLSPAAADFTALARSAWAIAGQGGCTLAERVLEALVAGAAAARLPAYGPLLRELQSLRISAQEYRRTGAQQAERALLDDELWRDFLLTRAWGKALSGDAAGSLADFQEAGPPSLAKAATAIDLYLCNIYALALFRNGRADEALAIEEGIGRRLDFAPQPNFHLRYINHFNNARLHRAAGRTAQERAHLEGVFATTDGLRTESDQIYLNLTLAALEEREGRADAALASTWRACVHWLSGRVPEAIGWRTLLALFSRRITLAPQDLGRVSQALLELLQRRVAACHLPLPTLPATAPSFLNIRQAPEVTSPRRVAHLAPRYGVLVAATERHASALDSAPHHPLAALVSALHAADAGLTGAPPATWLVDDGYGADIPQGRDGLVAAALRWDATPNASSGVTVDEAALLACTLTRGAGVADIATPDEGVVVSFKRYLAPFDAPRALQPIVKQLHEDGITLADAVALRPDPELLPVVSARHLLRRLEMARVARLVVPATHA